MSEIFASAHAGLGWLSSDLSWDERAWRFMGIPPSSKSFDMYRFIIYLSLYIAWRGSTYAIYSWVLFHGEVCAVEWNIWTWVSSRCICVCEREGDVSVLLGR
jgi:hypothetical protein